MYVFAAQQGPIMWYGDGHMMGMHWGWWIFWVFILLFLVWFVIQTTGGRGVSGPPPENRSPDDILRERFARGEISEEDFRRRLELLRESDGA